MWTLSLFNIMYVPNRKFPCIRGLLAFNDIHDAPLLITIVNRLLYEILLVHFLVKIERLIDDELRDFPL